MSFEKALRKTLNPQLFAYKHSLNPSPLQVPKTLNSLNI
jgi:hypothetical protein